jgi:hypothetical protein
MPVSAYGTYQVIPAAGGAWHVYAGGRRVFVKAHAAAPAPAPAAAPAPTQQQAVQTYQQAPAEFAPDAQYYAEQAQRLFQKNQQLASFDTAHTRDTTQLSEALRQMREQQPLQEGQATVGANKAGLFYGSALGNQLGQIAKTYAQRQSQAQTTYQQAEDARAAARAALEQGYTLDDAAARAAAVDRQIGRDQSAADAGALVAETPTAPTTVAAIQPPAAPKIKLPAVRAPRVVRSVRQPTIRAPARKPRRR